MNKTNRKYTAAKSRCTGGISLISLFMKSRKRYIVSESHVKDMVRNVISAFSIIPNAPKLFLLNGRRIHGVMSMVFRVIYGFRYHNTLRLKKKVPINLIDQCLSGLFLARQKRFEPPTFRLGVPPEGSLWGLTNLKFSHSNAVFSKLRGSLLPSKMC